MAAATEDLAYATYVEKYSSGKSIVKVLQAKFSFLDLLKIASKAFLCLIASVAISKHIQPLQECLKGQRSRPEFLLPL